MGAGEQPQTWWHACIHAAMLGWALQAAPAPPPPPPSPPGPPRTLHCSAAATQARSPLAGGSLAQLTAVREQLCGLVRDCRDLEQLQALLAHAQRTVW